MTVLVNDNAGLKVAITVRIGSVPNIHTHATVLAIRRSHEVSVVKTRTVLSVCNDGVIFATATLEVVLLEVPSELSEAISAID